MPATAAELAALHKITSSTGYRHVYRVTDSRRRKPFIARVLKDNQMLGYFGTAKEAATVVVEYLKRRGNITKKTKHSL